MGWGHKEDLAMLLEQPQCAAQCCPAWQHGPRTKCQQLNVRGDIKEIRNFALVLSHSCSGQYFSLSVYLIHKIVLRCHNPAKWNFLFGLADISAFKLSSSLSGCKR